jgi:hypothetical protein
MKKWKLGINPGILIMVLIVLISDNVFSQQNNQNKAIVDHYRFVGNHNEESMWSALYGAKSGKIYIGLCTHGEAAHFYEFDPQTKQMRHIVDLTQLHNERGKGINTNGKIHVQMAEDNDGNIYFAGLNEDTGPVPIDPSSYKGAYWYRYNPDLDKVEILGRISRYYGLLGMVLDKNRMRLYGLAENGHLYTHNIKKQYTRDLGRVDCWDVCRTIFMDDNGNVYGSYPVGRIWKHNPEKDRTIDLESIRLPIDWEIYPRTMSKPKLDRKYAWRIIEWDPLDKVAYGIMGGNSMLFKYDPDVGQKGKIEKLKKLCAPQYWGKEDFNLIPFATLAMTISNEHIIYYAPTRYGSFDYTGHSWDVRNEEKFYAEMTGGHSAPVSYLVTYNPQKDERKSLGQIVTKEGNMVFGLGGATTGKEGKIWFVGAVEENDKTEVIGKVGRKWPFSMGLFSYDPYKN